MKKALFAFLPLLLTLCLFLTPHAALSSEMASCSVSVGQGDGLVTPGATVTVSIHISVLTGSVSEMGIQLAEVPGLNLTNVDVHSGWSLAVNSSSYLNIRGSASAGESVSLTLTLDFAPDAHGTYVYDVYNVVFIDEYGEPMGAGGGSATFEVHTQGTEWVVALAPTCIEEGRAEIQCVNCTYAYEQAPIPMTAHTPGTPEMTTLPTCLLEGELTTFCTYCHAVLDTQAVPATGHTPGGWNTVLAATCTLTGSLEQRCTVCNELLETQTIPATGHTPGSWHTVSSADCTHKGKQEKRCTVCNELLDTRSIAARGHTPGEWKVTLRQTTTQPGVESLLCSVCGEVLETRELPAASEPRTNSLAALPGESMEEAAPELAQKWPTYTPVDLKKPQVLTFPLVAEGGYVVGTVTVTVDDKGTMTITCALTAKGASIKAGALAFLPTDRDLEELALDELTETALDPTQSFTYSASLADIPQKDGLAMLCLQFVIDFDVYAEGVQEYQPEQEV